MPDGNTFGNIHKADDWVRNVGVALRGANTDSMVAGRPLSTARWPEITIRSRLDFWSVITPELPCVKGLCTQVTSFMDEPTLRQRIVDLRACGIEGIAFVGVPRTTSDGEGSGVAPNRRLIDLRRPGGQPPTVRHKS
jgi:Mycobacterial methylenetetrahydrofolate reductase